MCEIRLVIKSGQSPRFFSSYQMVVRILERFSRATSVLRSGLWMNGRMKAHSWKVIYRYVISVSSPSLVSENRSWDMYSWSIEPAPGEGRGRRRLSPGRSSRARAESGPGVEEFHFTHLERRPWKSHWPACTEVMFFFVCLFFLYTSDWS